MSMATEQKNFGKLIGGTWRNITVALQSDPYQTKGPIAINGQQFEVFANSGFNKYRNFKVKRDDARNVFRAAALKRALNCCRQNTLVIKYIHQGSYALNAAVEVCVLV